MELFLLGVMVAYTPSLMLIAYWLWKFPTAGGAAEILDR